MHLYAKKLETPLYSSPCTDGDPVLLLSQGEWLGVVQQNNGWIQVLTAGGEGWILADDAEEKSHFQLHARYQHGLHIAYLLFPESK